ncbi:2-oxo-4-hydroxy-4-carboxy-5-ureidoimidazoline decarboxylase [Nocardia sp. NBC_01009]|uniref:2-oxo-4-hydroxy-4-carboxy-5-ureidoimidazoline decarboxylase n=1 Tax=Nocardia sp. NBC_01009 TaxID=2975996 RepID=UPI003867D0E1|nr:2-oxo-4-hydroxy-4-carboxy-5-ureidoimidazoline decarboxylase [Nocardia sp. NBC_01009]
MTQDGEGLAPFNALPETDAVAALLDCCSAPGWARAVASGRPYATVEVLLETADTVLAELSESEIDRALDGHPRIGDRPDTAASAREQAAVATAADSIRAALAEGNRAYEQRFGHIYLVCATGKSGAELLELLHARLGNDPQTERRVMRTELAKINRIRLRRLLGAAA